MKFQINLATRIYVNTKRLRFYTSVALLLLAVLLVSDISYIAANSEKVDRISKEIALSDKMVTGTTSVPEKQYQALLNRISFANSVIYRKQYNWLALLDNLEVVVPDGIAISSIEPDTKTQAVKIAGIAKGFTNLRILVEHMEDSKFFKDVYLLGQGNTKLSDNTPGITFNLSCNVIKR